MPRLGVYLIPEMDSTLYQAASDILGWDIWAEAEAPIPPDLAAWPVRDWVGPARAYGFHATIGDALEYADADVAQIEQILAEIAGATSAFRLEDGRIHMAFRAWPRALVGTFDSPDCAVTRLEEQVVTQINVRRQASPIFSESRDRLDGLALEQLDAYGSPMVRSLFDLHFTLASAVPDGEIWRLLADRWADDVWGAADRQTLNVTAIHLVQMRPDGRYRIRQSFPLAPTG